MTKKKPNTVKVDEYALEKVNNFLKVKENKVKYANRKHFISAAVLKLLDDEEEVKK